GSSRARSSLRWLRLFGGTRPLRRRGRTVDLLRGEAQRLDGLARLLVQRELTLAQLVETALRAFCPVVRHAALLGLGERTLVRVDGLVLERNGLLLDQDAVLLDVLRAELLDLGRGRRLEQLVGESLIQ